MKRIKIVCRIAEIGVYDAAEQQIDDKEDRHLRRDEHTGVHLRQGCSVQNDIEILLFVLVRCDEQCSGPVFMCFFQAEDGIFRSAA